MTKLTTQEIEEAIEAADIWDEPWFEDDPDTGWYWIPDEEDWGFLEEEQCQTI